MVIFYINDVMYGRREDKNYDEVIYISKEGVEIWKCSDNSFELCV